MTGLLLNDFYLDVVQRTSRFLTSKHLGHMISLHGEVVLHKVQARLVPVVVGQLTKRSVTELACFKDKRS